MLWSDNTLRLLSLDPIQKVRSIVVKTGNGKVNNLTLSWQAQSPSGKGGLTMATRVRSAVTGRFVPKSQAITRPNTTVTEKVKKRSK